TITVDTAELRNGTNCKIKVLANDGFNTTEAISGTFTVGNQPVILATSPEGNEVDVPPESRISIKFRDPMDEKTMTKSSIVMQGSGGTAIDSSISYDTNSYEALLIPDMMLEPNTVYNISVTSQVKNMQGLAIGSTYTFSFTTGERTLQPETTTTTTVPGGVTTTTTTTAGEPGLITSLNGTLWKNTTQSTPRRLIGYYKGAWYISLDASGISFNRAGFYLESPTGYLGIGKLFNLAVGIWNFDIGSYTCENDSCSMMVVEVGGFLMIAGGQSEYYALTETDWTPPAPGGGSTSTTTIPAVNRFIDNGNGTITDMRTGLIWLKKANPSGSMIWQDAMDYCAKLKSGDAGLTDESVPGQWRLPTKEVLEGIGTDPPTTWDEGSPSVTWTMPGAPFTDVQSGWHWSSTSIASSTSDAWIMGMGYGQVYDTGKLAYGYVWPVR
ncbi:MAG: DUF1566 domain-containing protein, partial [Pseudomonadota bacterium]